MCIRDRDKTQLFMVKVAGISHNYYQDDRVVTLNGYPLSQSSIQRILDVDCLNDEVHSIKILILMLNCTPIR